MKRLFFLFFPLLFIFPLTTKAAHLVGGDMSYTYIGTNAAGHQTYELTIVVYRDCFNSNTPFDQTIQVGVFNNNVNRSLFGTVQISNPVETVVNSTPAGSNCALAPNVCIRKGVYKTNITLPPSTAGYHILWQRCCRNNLTNMNTNEGQSYYSFIPPFSFQNNSPSFTGSPVPYVCVNDSITIPYGATDLDGDSLVYSFAWPYHGGTPNNPAPAVPNFLPNPIPTVNYFPTYSVIAPFGPGGMANIDPITGLVTLKSPIAGLFALAVDVKEYRNGVYLGATRRDVQIIVINCPPNPTPVRVSPAAVNYTIEAGTNIQFNITISDTDSIYLTRSGGIFDGSGNVQQPFATLNEISGKNSITSQFNWNTACHHARSQPYIFSVWVRDTGCPAKNLYIDFSILVTPFKGVEIISGPAQVCHNEKSVTYSVTGKANSTYEWYVTNGTIKSGNGSSQVVVDWFNQNGAIKVVEVSSAGCKGDTARKNVTVVNRPTPDAGNNTSFCSKDTISLGNPNADMSLTYTWSPATGILNPSGPNPKLTLLNNLQTPFTTQYVLSATNNVCTETDTVTITVNPRPAQKTITGNQNPCLHANYTYSVNHTPGSVYEWHAPGSNILSGQGTNSITVSFVTEGDMPIKVIETNQYGCVGDTIIREITPVTFSIDKIIGPVTVCPNSRNILYYVEGQEGSIYEWQVSDRGTIVSGLGTDSININWGDSGLATLWAIETTKFGCKSDTVKLQIRVTYRLETSPISGKNPVCEFTTHPYFVMEVNGSHYDWYSEGGTISSGNGTAKIFTHWGQEGSGLLGVRETAYDSINDIMCLGDTVYYNLIINPNPTTTPITGNGNICQYQQEIYSVTGFQGSNFIWEIPPGIFFTGQGSDQITVTWSIAGEHEIKVIEISKDSCPGQELIFPIMVYPEPVTTPIIGDSIVCAPNQSGFAYTVDGFHGSTYHWQINNGTIVSGEGTQNIIVDWNPSSFGSLQVKEESDFGCSGNEQAKTILLDNLHLEMQVVTTAVNNPEIIEVKWQVKDGEHFKGEQYVFKKQENIAWQLKSIENNNSRMLIDADVKTSETIYEYEIAAINQCHDTVRSGIHNSIVLKGQQTNNINSNLNWNPYSSWENGVLNYDIYRRLNHGTTFEFYRDALLANSFIENTGIDGFKQCYRIKAKEENGNNKESWSNELCLEFDAVIYIPSAFSPNGDIHNEGFRVIASNIKSFYMEIYNRWGERIFTSSDLNEAWMGTYKGVNSPDGIYHYRVIVEDNRDLHLLSGKVTLIR